MKSRIPNLERRLAEARNELLAACQELAMKSATGRAISRKLLAEREVRNLETELRAETERVVRQTTASLGPDSVVRLLDPAEYAAICDAANRLGRTWKSQLQRERARGGYWERLGIPAEHRPGLQRATSRLSANQLSQLVATQTIVDPETEPGS